MQVLHGIKQLITRVHRPPARGANSDESRVIQVTNLRAALGHVAAEG